ncbi:STAS domain-containing protein [Conexibacter woesei]|uniref:STAS domain-containing protein n=1 Tax=Conexibacter woesei TaxID=191495 RepID=UPI000403DE50|nr:STAS domain-containing protein [Conexibacter woesei]
MDEPTSVIETILRDQRAALLDAWVAAQLSAPGVRTDLISERELRVDSDRFLTALSDAVTADSASADVSGPDWATVRGLLTDLSRSRATQGFSPTETATFVFSFKQPLFGAVQAQAPDDSAALTAALWQATELIDALGLFTSEAYLRSREEVIRRQQDELIELSTPVVKLWDGVVALPLIGTLDSARTQVVMESLLERIVETDSTIAIIDITGVPTVDTLVAQHLLKTVAAARLMGADCIVSGIRPQIAQTIVHLGLDLSEVITKSSLADAVVVALERTGFEITRRRTKLG